MTKTGKARKLKVWVWPEALLSDLRNGGTATVHPRRDGFKLRVRATLIIPHRPPAKRRK